MTFAHGPYDIANVSVDGVVCYTNNVRAARFAVSAVRRRTSLRNA